MSVPPNVPVPAVAAALSTWSQALLVACGGTVGCLLRWRAGVWLNTPAWPIGMGTLLVNIVGGLVIGFVLVALTKMASPDAWRLLLITGMLGGLTTFSAFTGESLGFLQKGQIGLAVLHTLVHVLGALGAAALGSQIGRWVLG